MEACLKSPTEYLHGSLIVPCFAAGDGAAYTYTFQVVASVQTLGRRGSGAARLRQYASYGGVIIVDEVSPESFL